ncbi:MAG: helix-hairpin-helix domain-containing protein [Bacteroidales bacterium]|nr:helix-hairpin-helix domain-containing protein [Bacteroidales bacterium]
MKTKSKIGISLIIGIFLGIFIILLLIVFKSERIAVLNLNEEPKTKSVGTTEGKVNDKKYNKYNRNTFRRSNKKNIYAFNSAYQNQNTVSPTPQFSAAKEIILDINTADTLDLQMLRGIGPSYARRIYKYGQLLGGYVSIEQLKEVYGMSDSLYEMIKPHFVLNNRQVRKININTDNIKELSSHPYIDYYLAKAIINFRKSYGDFAQIEDLKKVHIMTEEDYKRIEPYVSIE